MLSIKKATIHHVHLSTFSTRSRVDASEVRILRSLRLLWSPCPAIVQASSLRLRGAQTPWMTRINNRMVRLAEKSIHVMGLNRGLRNSLSHEFTVIGR
jgi:hypothetical protein